MAFPWKRAKSSLLSRLVADLHRPPKQGGTLVVETGFPTSLVDLIVKNRDRLRKSPERNSSSRIQTPLPSLPPRSSLVPRGDGKVQSSQIDVGKLVLVQRECAGCGRISFRAAFKFIMVVALAVTARQLTFWIMMAAFLLLLLEFVGASVFGFFLPEFHAILLGSRIEKGFLGFKKRDWEQTPTAEELIVKQQETVLPDSVKLIDLEDDCVEEIQIVESEFNCAGETQIETIRERSELCRGGTFKRHLVKKAIATWKEEKRGSMGS